MDFNLVNYIEGCYAYKTTIAPMEFIRYSHIPNFLLALVVGLFVFAKNRKNIASKILLSLAVAFSFWIFLNLILWEAGYNSLLTMFSWSLLGIFSGLIIVLSVYFFDAFIEKKDISFPKKITLALLLLPIILLTPSRFNLTGFDAVNCEAIENKYFSNYYYILGLVAFLWILGVAISKYKEFEDENRKQFLLATVGIELFLVLFFSAGYFASILGGMINVNDYRLEAYGIFGMTIFLGLLAYLIVKYKAFEIKMLAAQVLVAGLVILVGSEFFFIPMENTTSVILLSVTVLLATIFGIWLINSVKNEVRRKEELQVMSDSLATANDRLKKLDNAKSEFISIASHQLRTPLTSIKGYISLITEGTYGAVSAEVKDALSRVYLSNERLIKLVENLLNVSRIESGRMEYTWEKGSVENIIMGLLDDFIFAAKKNGLYLNAKMPEAPLPQIRMDKAKLTEVISNTIDNAIKYTKKGGVTVTAEISNSNDQKDSIRITVSDTGIGIPKENMDEMFQKFSRGKDTTRLHATGTGLGMFVAKNIIEAHQGRIWVESEGQDKGSRFIIELPVE